MIDPRTTSSNNNDPRAGFSLVEVMVSMVIMAYGVLGLAGATMYTIRGVSVSELNTERAAAIQVAREKIHSQPFDSLDTGTDTVGVFVLEWSSTMVVGSKLVELVSTGPGVVMTEQGPLISPARSDTLGFRVVEP